MNRKDMIIRMLIATSGVIFSVSAVIREWKLTLVAIVPMVIAVVYGVVGTTPDTPGKALEELLKKDKEPRQ